MLSNNAPWLDCSPKHENNISLINKFYYHHHASIFVSILLHILGCLHNMYKNLCITNEKIYPIHFRIYDLPVICKFFL